MKFALPYNNFIPDNENPDMIDLNKKAEIFNLFDFIFESKKLV